VPSVPTTSPAGNAGQPVTLSISAQNLAFSRSSISAPANTQVTVNFQNNDTNVPHDFGVSLPGVAHTATCNGPCSGSIAFNSGAPGAYTFQCSVHQEMVGDFTVR
jgi:plastocyanin